ncbi:hypothetical protein PTSG_06821 [Salpingoeca rosetta]|uniref:Mitochondrial cardiolipin hydrolase n=1 Tax=Salpingoeca rosetta (strain ATCC 50818 / BSB-021) TaxID=946362 RepID=F2UEW8_SALR5|nr:uncharacterized protein PTSG_06821 [Salpingoeca rosetta]EGD75168.1 hypothetical protein PTSG_06821 [Salpingoeca rosetta]|eukprot:XP_004992221.1 hypothetical protein PTSG_06821 [Salpingoeca rosetta]
MTSQPQAARSHRMGLVEQILQKQHRRPLSKQDEEDILSHFRDLESDLELTKRRITRRSQFVNRTKEERGELVEQIAFLQEDIYALQEQVSLREATIRKQKQVERQLKADITRIEEEKAAILSELEVLSARYAPLAQCDSIVLSRVLTPSLSPTTSQEGRTRGNTSLAMAKSTSSTSIASNGQRNGGGSSDADDDDAAFGDDGGDDQTLNDSTVSSTGRDGAGCGGFMRTLADCITAASSEVLVMTQTFTSRALADVLASASQRGITVRVIVDASWLNITLRASGASRDYQCWQRVYRRFKAAGVEWGAQRGRRHIARPTSTHVPFTHNAIIVDGLTLITGPLRFADEACANSAESSLVVVRGTSRNATPCIQSMHTLFTQMWGCLVEVDVPQEMTRVRLPKI